MAFLSTLSPSDIHLKIEKIKREMATKRMCSKGFVLLQRNKAFLTAVAFCRETEVQRALPLAERIRR